MSRQNSLFAQPMKGVTCMFSAGPRLFVGTERLCGISRTTVPLDDLLDCCATVSLGHLFDCCAAVSLDELFDCCPA